MNGDRILIRHLLEEGLDVGAVGAPLAKKVVDVYRGTIRRRSRNVVNYPCRSGLPCDEGCCKKCDEKKKHVYVSVLQSSITKLRMFIIL